jgi:mannose-6-phosphate isomerase-like protein (cupin superfamily)
MQSFQVIKLNPIETKGKPGKLTEVNIKNICKEYNLEFSLYKCFYVNELNSTETRGNHSNDNVSEILVCLQGSFEIKLHDGKNETIIQIKQNEAVYIAKNVWISYYNFNNCVIMAMISMDSSLEKKSCYDFNEFMKLHSL